MKPKDFEEACNDALNGWLWDSTFSRDYMVSIKLSVYEMRIIANYLRGINGLPVMMPVEDIEINREKYSLSNDWGSETEFTD